MASANQQLQQRQAQRATTTDPEKLKGLDAAISGGKFQLDVMQQALDRENKNVADLQASAAKVASLPPAPAAPPPAAPAAAPAQPAVPLKITTTEQKGLEQALRTIPGKLSAPEKKTFNSLSVLAQKAVSKGLTPAEGAELLSGIPALARPVAAPLKPRVANVPKPVAAAVPPKPKAVVAPPKPAAPVMQPIRH